MSGNEYAYVEIQGLRAFRQAVKAAATESPEAMRKANADAARHLIKVAKRKAQGYSHRTANKAADSLRVSNSVNFSAVLGGGARYKYFYGAEFGSYRYKRFQTWRGNQWTNTGWSGGPGYFLNPAVRDAGPEILRNFMKQFEAITAEAFPE